MKLSFNKFHDRFTLVPKPQREKFMSYFPEKVYIMERNISIIVALMQLFMIIFALATSSSLFHAFRSTAYFFLYVFLFLVTMPIIILSTYAIRNKKYKMFIYSRRVYAFLICMWVIGVTFLEYIGGKGVTVFCYFLPCAAAVVFLLPIESICIFGSTWFITITMFYAINPNSPDIINNLINVSIVTILTIFISYRYYRSTAIEFCNIETINEQYREIQEKNVQLQHTVYLDQLTGLYNRRYLLENTYKEYEECSQNNYECLIMMVDIDHFKKYNDSYGHMQGDECLRQVSTVLKTICEKHSASAIRYGGEEFIVVQMAKTIPTPKLFAEEMQQGFIDANIERTDVPEKRTTVSIGLWHGQTDTINGIEEAIRLADYALYEAKETGRNRTVFYNENINFSR